MLKYLVETTEQIITLMLMLGLMYGYVKRAFGDKCKWFIHAGVLLGIVFSAIMSWFRLNTNKVVASEWNLRIHTITTGLVGLFIIVTAFGKLLKKAEKYIVGVILFGLTSLLVLYFLPTIIETPHTILLSEETVLSTGFLLKMVGAILAIALTWVLGIAVSKIATGYKKYTAFSFLIIELLINTSKEVTSAITILISKRMIKSNHTLFMIAKNANNYSKWFIYSALIVALVYGIVHMIMGFTQKEPYNNPAERRKIIAKWRKFRRASITAIVCSALSVFILTAVNKWANKVIELSPIEDAVVENGNVYVPFEQVSDGHLHRFGYTTDNGVTIRFIVIKKPNSSSFGIGLDACDICGETGYYEKKGQVVCNLCDVVMNINTIGFKGGCNPIIIDYSIEDGYIVVPISGLIEYESEFK